MGLKALVGRSGTNAMSADELWEKFEDCAARTLPAAQIKSLFDALLQLDNAPDFTGVCAMMQGAS